MQHRQLRSCEHKAESELGSTTAFSCPSLQNAHCSDNPSEFEKHNNQADQLAQLASIGLGREHKGNLFLARWVHKTVVHVPGQRMQLRLVSGSHGASN